MRVSQGELKSLFKQAFEGCGFGFGPDEVAAELVVWAQMHGLDVFPLFNEYLEPLGLENVDAKILLDDPQALIFDNRALSVLVSGFQIVNLVSAKALNQGFCFARVLNCRHALLIAKLISESNHHGLYAQAYWYEEKTKETFELKSDGEHGNFEFRCYSNAKCSNEGELNIVFAEDEVELHKGLSQYRIDVFTEATVKRQLSSDYFIDQYQRSLSQGIEINVQFWQQLIKIGSSVLVESNELSRLGAGD